MTDFELRAIALTAEAFAPFGDVIESAGKAADAMNAARFRRSRNLAAIDIDPVNGGHVTVSLAETLTPVSLPYRFDLIERHPLASQAFVPLANIPFTVVVAPSRDRVEPGDLLAFRTNGNQGINYHRGIWHMPLIATSPDEKFLIIDRAPGSDNYEEMVLSATVVLKTE